MVRHVDKTARFFPGLSRFLIGSVFPSGDYPFQMRHLTAHRPFQMQHSGRSQTVKNASAFFKAGLRPRLLRFWSAGLPVPASQGRRTFMVNALRAGIPAEVIMRCGRQELRGDAALCQNSGRTGARERLREVSTRWRAKSWDTIPDTTFIRNDALFHVSNPVKNALRTTFLAIAK